MSLAGLWNLQEIGRVMQIISFPVVLRLLYQQAVRTAHRTGLEVFLSQARDVAKSQAALHSRGLSAYV